MLSTNSGATTISDAIKFRHHYLPSPELSTEDKLLHAVQAINNTLARSSAASNDEQLAAIKALRTILHGYKQPQPLQGMQQQPLPGVPPPLPTAHPLPWVPRTPPTLVSQPP